MTKSSGADAGQQAGDPWVDLPSLATVSGVGYFRQHIRDIFLMASEQMLVLELESVINSVAKAVLPDRPPREAFSSLFKTLDRSESAALRNFELHKEIAAVRCIDNYLVYLSELIKELSLAKPETLRSQRQVRLEPVFPLQKSNASAASIPVHPD